MNLSLILDFSLNDLKSRTKNFLLQNIEKPDDELMFALILKIYQIVKYSIDKKLINYILKELIDPIAKYLILYIKLMKLV